MQQFAQLAFLASTALLMLLSGQAPASQNEASQTEATEKAASQQIATAPIPALRTYSPTFSSSGQPSAEQLQQLQQEGFQRIIYIAFSDHENSLLHEDRVVKSLGMDYLQIPVVWATPSASDFALFASAMQLAPTQKTLQHCQVNYRASAFAMLYRVIYLEVSLEEAMADMHGIWTPTEHWVAFMQTTLQAYGKPTACDGCKWQPVNQD